MKNSPPTETRGPPQEENVNESSTESRTDTTTGTQLMQEEELPLDVIFSLLKNRRRRLVLRYLLTISETSTLSDLAEYVAAVEHDKSEDDLTSSERKRVYVCLYQCHLPKMADADIIEFESDRGSVRLDKNVDQLSQYLDLGETTETSRWPIYYGGLAIVGGGLFLVQRYFLQSEIVSGILMGVLVGLFLSLAVENGSERGIFPNLQIRHRNLVSTDTN